MFKTTTIAKLIGAAVITTAASQAVASGFAVTTQNTSGLGNAFAGQAALAENATAMWYNPASLTRLDRQFSVSAILIAPNSDFSASLPSGGTIVDDSVVPSLSLSYPLNDKTTLGLNINSPFGNKRDYEQSFVGLDLASFSEIKTANINLALGHQINDVVAIGAGINYQTIEADLKASAASPFGASNSQLEGDDDSYGFNIGLQYTPDTKTAFGISYRSSTDFTVDGNVNVASPAAIVVANPSTPPEQAQQIQTAFGAGLLTTTSTIVSNIPATADVKMPASLNLSVSHYINEKAQLLFSTVYTQWDSLQSLDVKSKSSGNVISSEPFEFDNTMHYSLGANYNYCDKLTLRAGLAYDETPVPNPQLRSLRSPDSSRTWLSVGANYQLNQNINIDAGYAYVSLEDADVDKEVSALGRPAFTGTYETDAHILGVQANIKF